MDVSVVIATRDRRPLLARTLATLGTLPQAPGFEVVVADHGSTDGTAELVASYAGRLPVRRVPVRFARSSIADPKNAGARAATGELLVFLDSGMLCHPRFLAAHVAAHRAGNRVVAGAVFGWDSEDDGAPFGSEMNLTALPAALPAEFADPRALHWADCQETAWMLVWGANMSLARADFLGCGGFDPRLTGWGWDDMELAYRLNRLGRLLDYAPGAWAVHYPHPRMPMAARLASARRNWLRAYHRHRSPDLETWESCGFWDHASCQRRMRVTVAALRGQLPAAPARRDASTRRVLYGFMPPPRPHPADTFLVMPGPGAAGGGIACYGLRTGLRAAAAPAAVVSPAVLAFDWSPSPGWPPVAAGILREMSRVAGAVEVHGRLPGPATARIRELARMAGLAGLTMAEG
jgi:glycosyltransferase involved in cell wall biosynthesis